MTLETGQKWLWGVLNFSKLALNPYHAKYVYLRFKKAILPALRQLVIAQNHLIFSQFALVFLESWCLELSNGTKIFV